MKSSPRPFFCLKFARGVTKKRVDQAARALEEEFLNKKLVVVGIKAFRINVHKKDIYYCSIGKKSYPFR